MKTRWLVLAALSIILFLVVRVAWADPPNIFIGQWDGRFYSVSATLTLEVTESGYTMDLPTGFPWVQSSDPVHITGGYLYDTHTVTLNGTTWLYYLRGVNSIGLLGWVVMANGAAFPIEIMLARKSPAPAKSG